jgi:serine phosphatase RsbU (regulator of sigma subunit)/PAS domain-containing protein
MRGPVLEPEAAAGLPTLQAMLEQLVQGCAVFDASHRLCAWNQQLQELLKLSEAELAGAPTLEQFIRRLASRGDFGTGRDGVEAAVQEHLHAPETPYLAERMLPDGRILECRRNPLSDGGLIVMYADLSEQRHSDYLVKESARQLRFMLDRAPVALAMIGQDDGRLKHCNARFRKLFGLSDPHRGEQTDLAALFTAEDRARILSARTGAPAIEFETSVRRADASAFYALVAAVRYVFEWEPTSLVSFHDISARRRAEAGLRDELRRRQAELDEARRLQLELVPAPLCVAVGGVQVAVDVVMEPAKEVGGDLVDCFPVEDRVVVVLGDVSHKGAAAALFMARTHSLIRGLATRPDASALFAAPGQALALVNAALVANNALCMFVTLFVATYDLKSGRLDYVRAGHVPPWLRQASGELERLDILGGPPLGLVEDVAYRQGVIALGRGDRLLAVTDGITEAVDPSDTQFGEARVEALLAEIGPGDGDVLARLTAEVRTFEAGRPPFDDIAALLVTIGAFTETS